MSFSEAAPPPVSPFEPEPATEPPDRDSEMALNGETTHDQARRLIGRALIGNIAEAYRVLALRLRQDYARTLTESEQAFAVEWLEKQVETAQAMFRDGVSNEFPWPDADGSPDGRS